LLHRSLEIGRCDLGALRNVAQINADAWHDTLLQRILVDRYAALAEMPWRVNMRARVVRHRDEHRRKSINVFGIGERFLVSLPHAVHDGGMAGVARRAVIQLTAEIDDFHGRNLFKRNSADDDALLAEPQVHRET